jgi:transcriptional regulator with XRE-family HTH domain
VNEKQQQRLYQLLGENVKKYRNQNGLTQEQLANEIDLTRTSVVNIEQGRQHPPLHLLLQIAKVLDISLETLIPKEAEFSSAKLLDDSSLIGVKEEDKSKLTIFYKEFLKTSQNHE